MAVAPLRQRKRTHRSFRPSNSQRDNPWLLPRCVSGSEHIRASALATANGTILGCCPLRQRKRTHQSFRPSNSQRDNPWLLPRCVSGSEHIRASALATANGTILGCCPLRQRKRTHQSFRPSNSQRDNPWLLPRCVSGSEHIRASALATANGTILGCCPVAGQSSRRRDTPVGGAGIRHGLTDSALEPTLSVAGFYSREPCEEATGER